MTAIKVTRFSAQSKLLLLSRVMLAISLASSLIFILLQSSLFNVNSSSPVSPSSSSSSSSSSSASQLTSSSNSFYSSHSSSSPSASFLSKGQFSTLQLFNRRITLNSKSNSNVNNHLHDEKTLTRSRNNEKANNLHSNFTSTTRFSNTGNSNSNSNNNNNLHQSTPRRHSSFHRIKGPKELFSVNDGIQVSYFVDNCGLNHDCPKDHFSIHLFTGFENQMYPKLCIDGKYVLDKGINGAGRGMNVAIVDPITRAIISVSNFDTYDKDSTALETLLLTVRDGDIVILLTFDEPSSKLSHVARLLLAELGSGKAQNINYRTSWYMVSQKGITGYTPYEEIHLPSLPASSPSTPLGTSSLSFTPPSPSSPSSSSSFFSSLPFTSKSSTLAASSSSSSSSSSLGVSSLPKSAWGLPHDVRTCLPLSFEGVAIQADDTIRENSERKKFCRLFAHIWPLFCESHIINDPLVPSSVMRIPVSVDLFKTPIILMTPPDSLYSMSDLSLTLETLVRQPGIEPKNVIVFYNSSCCEAVRHLVNLFGFMSAEYTQDQWQDLPGDIDIQQPSSNSDKGSLREEEKIFSSSSSSSSSSPSSSFAKTFHSTDPGKLFLRKRSWRNRHKQQQQQQQQQQQSETETSYSDTESDSQSNSWKRESVSSHFTEKDDETRVKSKVNLFKDCIETTQLLFPEGEQLILIESHLILSPDFLSFFGQMMPLLVNSMKDPANSGGSGSNKIVAISAWNENGFLTSSSDPSMVYLGKVSNYIPRLAMMIPRVKDFNALDFPPSVSWSFDQYYSFHHQSNFHQRVTASTTTGSNSNSSEYSNSPRQLNGSMGNVSSKRRRTSESIAASAPVWPAVAESGGPLNQGRLNQNGPGATSASGRRQKYIFNHAIDLPSRQSGYIVFPDVSRVALIVPPPPVKGRGEYNEHHHHPQQHPRHPPPHLARSLPHPHPSRVHGEVDSFENSLFTTDHQTKQQQQDDLKQNDEDDEQVKSFVSQYMASPRNLNLDEEAKIPNVDSLMSLSSYELMIRTLIDQSSASFKNNIEAAINWIENVKVASTRGKSKTTIVTVSERNWMAHERFCKYFHLVNCRGQIWLKGVGSVLRFTVPYNIQVVLIDQSEL